MTIVQSLNDLRSRIDAFEVSSNTAARKQVYDEVNTLLEERIAAAEKLRLRCKALVDNDVTIDRPAEFGHLSVRLGELRSERNDAVETMRTAPQWNELQEVENELLSVVEQVWATVRESLVAHRPEIGPFLREQASDEDLAQVEKIDRQLERLSATPPTAADVLTNAREALKQREAIFARLRSGIPVEAEKLLERISREDVALADLTEAELALLRTSGFATAIRIVWGPKESTHDGR